MIQSRLSERVLSQCGRKSNKTLDLPSGGLYSGGLEPKGMGSSGPEHVNSRT